MTAAGRDWHVRRVRGGRVGAAVAAGLLLLLTPAPATPAEREAVVPAGLDDLLADLLGRGATLGGCTFAGGAVQRTTLQGTYDCPGGSVVVLLRHPALAAAGDAQTGQFAVALTGGSPPADFRPALLDHIRSREAAFEWKWVGAPAVPRTYWALPLVAGLVFAVVLVGGLWLLRRRRR